MLSVNSGPRLSVAWNTSLIPGIVRGAFITGTGDIGAISAPAALVPANGSTPVQYTLSGYYNFRLSDFPVFDGDTFSQFKEYRIRSFRVTLTDRMPVWTSVAGGGNFSTGPGCTEVMLVNTSKTGEFVMPISMGNTALAVTAAADPWNQVLNYPSVRNIAMVKKLSAHKPVTLSLKVDAMENYVTRQYEDVDFQGPLASTGYEFSGITPQTAFYGTAGASAASTAGQQMNSARFKMKRRRFRWTNQWLMFQSTTGSDDPNLIYIRNDDKVAHGCQMMVKALSYWTSSLPYFDVAVTMSVEFRGKLMQRAMIPITNSSSMLFPWTNATYVTTV